MDTRDSQTFFARDNDVRDSLSLPDACAGSPLTIVMNNPEVPKIHGVHNLQAFLFQDIVVGKGKDQTLPRTTLHSYASLLRRSRGQHKGVCLHMVIVPTS
jgi:hypothetical protein